MSSLPPGSILILGALLIPLTRSWARRLHLVALPVLSLVHLHALPFGDSMQLEVFDHVLTLSRIDRLALVFGLVFHLAAFLNLVFSLHEKDTVQHVFSVMYAGSAIGATFAGDLVTFFVYWELTAITSVFLIWARKTERSYRAGMRYLVLQVGSGVLLLAGILFHLDAGGTIAFDHLEAGTLGPNLILLALGLKCAFPLLHMWLPDGYPEATVTGTVFLSAFTTKLAVYALARGFAGLDALVWIGATMTIFPIFFALLVDDFRRLLSYSLIIQLGFMVTAVGVGTELAINGAAAHAVAHILYKALLFMAVGAVLHRTGTARASRLGGLFPNMPWTATFCMVGAASIAAVPLFCGFVSKSLITAAVAEEHLTVVWLILIAASGCSVLYVSLRVPYFLFFGERRAELVEVEEAPRTMLLAMGATAALCLLVGIFPGPLYDALPYPGVTTAPYTLTHVVTQLQLLVAGALVFFLLLKRGLYPRPAPGTILDADWIYRRLLPRAIGAGMKYGTTARDSLKKGVGQVLQGAYGVVCRLCAPQGLFNRTWPTGSTVLMVALILTALLLLYYS